MKDATRLDKLVANLGYGSRREVALLARAGRIRLAGAALPDPDRKLTPAEAAALTIDGEPLDLHAPTICAANLELHPVLVERIRAAG